jgi:predicted urease superfamily metal-dependent hydrolase
MDINKALEGTCSKEIAKEAQQICESAREEAEKMIAKMDQVLGYKPIEYVTLAKYTALLAVAERMAEALEHYSPGELEALEAFRKLKEGR